MPRLSSPVQWSQLFRLPDQPGLGLQARLRQAMVQAMDSGRLVAGAPLPSSRELARLLGLSRNTVMAAFEQLVDEGFLESRPRSGMIVAHRSGAQRPAPVVPSAGGRSRPPDWAQRLRRSLAEQRTLSKPEGWQAQPYPFVFGGFDEELFPAEAFRECCMRALSRGRTARWAHDLESADLPDLVEQIRLHLLPRRGVFALDSEILVTVGAPQAFQLLAEALCHADTRLGFEEPGHPHARNAFQWHRTPLVPLPLDSHGLKVDSLPPLDYVFVTPSHQSPTTVTLPIERRLALLQCAEEQDMVVIEDDYEAENLHTGTPMPALKSLDKSGRVIYIGSLAKSLSPVLRLGYIVAPQRLVAELRRLRHTAVRHPSSFLQQAWALFIALGHHDRHARQVNQLLRQRLQLTLRAMAEQLPGFEVLPPQGGASLWVAAPAWVDAAELAELAQAQGVLIEPGNVFFARPPYPCPWFRLRLSSIPTARIPAGIAALASAVRQLAIARGQTGAATPGTAAPTRRLLRDSP